MRKFSIPYNGDILLLESLQRQLPDEMEHIQEIYLAVPRNILMTGRNILQSADYYNEVESIIQQAGQMNIESNLLLNAGCFGEKIVDASLVNTCVNYLDKLLGGYQNINITVTDFLLAKKIKQSLPEIKLECSSVSYVDSLQKAKFWYEIGCSIMVLPPALNKNIHFIKELTETFPEMKLKIIANEVCLPSCPMRTFHNNTQNHGNSGEVYVKECRKKFVEEPWLFYSSSYLPPSQLYHYDPYVSLYKLIDRTKPTEKIIKAIGTYCSSKQYERKAQEWNGRIPDKLFQTILKCNKNCKTCGICKDIYINKKADTQFVDKYLSQFI